MGISNSDGESVLNLRAGDMVEVRSKEEILATLDANGTREALPFMPEMLKYCGKRFRVYKRADKTCDTIRQPVSLRMKNAVHLEDLRCNGAAHGGCQAGCMIFWKEGWLKRIDRPEKSSSRVNGSEIFGITDTPVSQRTTGVCTEETVIRATRRQTNADGDVFSCQATELPKATSRLAWWDVRQYARDIRSGNTGLAEVARGMSVAMVNMLMRVVRRCVLTMGHRVVRSSLVGASAPGIGSSPNVSSTQPPSRIEPVIEQLKSIFVNVLVEHPHIQGKLRNTPSTRLNLQPGELVEIKSKAEILETLDINNRNRGLLFDVEMVPYCGGTYRVLRRVERILNEKTGRMLTLPNNCIILEGVVCRGCLSRNRLFCPRSIYPYWHEVWLRRIE